MHEARQNNAFYILEILVYPVTFRAKYWCTKSARIEFKIVFPYFYIPNLCIYVFSVNGIVEKNKYENFNAHTSPSGRSVCKC